MADDSTRQVVLMSIRPEYARKILSGDKVVEFRRTRLRGDINRVVIYETAPTGMIVGAFEVEGIEEGTPADLWSRHGDHGGVSQDRFTNYFDRTSRAVAIRIGRVYELAAPRPLGDLVPLRRPPQSYCYVASSVFAAIHQNSILAAATSEPGQ